MMQKYKFKVSDKNSFVFTHENSLFKKKFRFFGSNPKAMWLIFINLRNYFQKYRCKGLIFYKLALRNFNKIRQKCSHSVCLPHIFPTSPWWRSMLIFWFLEWKRLRKEKLLQTKKIHSYTKLRFLKASRQTTPAAFIIKPQIYLLSAQNLKTLFSKEK